MKLRPALAAILAAIALPAAAIGHRADIALIDRATGAELPVHWHEGRAYVVGRPGNEYQVVVRNRRGEDVLAVVSVDGLNVMDGKEASPSQSGYVLSPWERLDVRGWRKSLDEIAAFYFTSLGDSYAGRTGRPQNVGVIGVALFNRKPVHYEAPPRPYSRGSSPSPMEKSEAPRLESQSSPGYDAPSAPRAESGSSADQSARRHAPAPAQTIATAPPPAMPSAPLGTGHGKRETSRVRWVDFERASNTPVETITVHYDSYRNLVAMGVLAPRYAERRAPNPFPNAFTPDP
jgi:hypothetical protein